MACHLCHIIMLLKNKRLPASYNLKPLQMSKILTTLLCLAFLLFVPVSHAKATQQERVTIESREVILNENGTWQYRSTDRFANTRSGNRVRLKEDGSWQHIDNISLTPEAQTRTDELDIKLQKVVIEKYIKKALKNTRVKTQTVFYIHLNNTLQAKTDIDIEQNDISLIKIKDNNGKNYPVLSIKADISSLQYGKGITVIVRADKSPTILDDAKSMKMILKAGVFGIKNPISLSQKIVDFDEVNVDGFE
jgi:hypothetical protein